MKVLIIVLAAVMAAACATNPENVYRAEMGWNSILKVYLERQRDCFEGGDIVIGAFLPDQCEISKNEAKRANQIIKAYRYYAKTFVASSDRKINACEMASLAYKLSGIADVDSSANDIDLFCGSKTIDSVNMNRALKEAVEVNL